MSDSPLITIGVPAYNAAAHIGLTLEGFLAQTCGDFELIVSDNASTDGTRDAVEQYRKQDARIQYCRQPVNIGANPNYAHVMRRARGTFFKWSSSSDWCAPGFLEHCKNELQADHDLVLAVPRTRLFHETPDQWEDYPWDVEIMDDRPSARLVRLATTLALNNVMNGLIRTSALRRTRDMEPYVGADFVLMGHLALLGKFKLLDERLFYRRMDVDTATALKDQAAIRRHHYPQSGGGALFQAAKRQMGWLRVALATPIPYSERVRSLMHVIRTCYWERHALLGDLQGAWQHYIRGTRGD